MNERSTPHPTPPQYNTLSISIPPTGIAAFIHKRNTPTPHPNTTHRLTHPTPPQYSPQADFDLRASVMGKRPTRSPLDAGADAETAALYHRLVQALDTMGPGDPPFDMPEAVPFFRRKVSLPR